MAIFKQNKSPLQGLRDAYAGDPRMLRQIDAGASEGVREGAELGAQIKSRKLGGIGLTDNEIKRNTGIMALRNPDSRYYNSEMYGDDLRRAEARARENARASVRDLGSMTGAEAEARVRANPRLAEGGVFGRNDREMAMQRNRDFIASGRGSMFGPRPASSRVRLQEGVQALKGQELANQREANLLMAGNDRYKTSALAALRRGDQQITAANNAAKVGIDQAEINAKLQLGQGKLANEQQANQLMFNADMAKTAAELQKSMDASTIRSLSANLLGQEAFVKQMVGNQYVQSMKAPNETDEQTLSRLVNENPVLFAAAFYQSRGPEALSLLSGGGQVQSLLSQFDIGRGTPAT